MIGFLAVMAVLIISNVICYQVGFLRGLDRGFREGFNMRPELRKRLEATGLLEFYRRAKDDKHK